MIVCLRKALMGLQVCKAASRNVCCRLQVIIALYVCQFHASRLAWSAGHNNLRVTDAGSSAAAAAATAC
jgi:hypothetical protein